MTPLTVILRLIVFEPTLRFCPRIVKLEMELAAAQRERANVSRLSKYIT